MTDPTAMLVKKKRDWSLHSRSERNKRKMAQVAPDFHSIKDYFPVLQLMERVMAENIELRENLTLAMKKLCSAESYKTPIPENKMLSLMLECAHRNAGKKSEAWRYVSTLKEFATLCFCVGGPQMHLILAAAFPAIIPSISACRRNLHSADRMEECYFRLLEAKAYLQKRNLPTKVVIAEDGTRVTGRIQYDPKTNQISGFVPNLDENGCPNIRSFPATSAQLIKQYFESGIVSNNAYVIMLQPLANKAAAFCLALWGTDNRFEFTSVSLRWEWMIKAFSDVGLEIVAFSSDGDSRLLKAMTLRTFSSKSPQKWPWFKADLDVSLPVCVQDPIHILVKLKSKLLKPSEIIPMGKKHLASRGHIVQLISCVSKDQHEISMSFMDSKDKMNHRAAQKLCDEKVTTSMREAVPESEATATYLDMMRDVSSAFMEPSLLPLDRIKTMWEWIFFLRHWRTWIQSNPDYTLGHNFISQNSYICLELNAHALINLIRKLRDSEDPHLFLIWLVSSQACEKFFGSARTMTSVLCTVLVFSILELIHRIRRIDFIAESKHNLQDVIDFKSQKKSYQKSTGQPAIVTSLPEDYEIEVAVKEASELAFKRCVALGIANRGVQCTPPCPIRPNDAIQLTEDDAEIDDDLMTYDSDSDENCTNEEIVENDDLNDVAEDLLMVSSGIMGMQTFNNVTVTPDSPFIKVLDGLGNPCIIKKTSFCWFLSSGDTKMSSDRLMRVQKSNVSHSDKNKTTCLTNKPSCEDEVAIGDWCAFTSETGSIMVARVIAFSYMSGKTWRNQEYSLLTAPVKPPDGSARRGIGCLCSWFNIAKNGKLSPVSMDTQGYYSIEHYICTIPRPKTVHNSLYLTCTVSDIRRMKNKKS